MQKEVMQGIFLPFLGTTLGAACVFTIRKTLHAALQRTLTGFAAGIMTAASVWSLFWTGRFRTCTSTATNRKVPIPG